MNIIGFTHSDSGASHREMMITKLVDTALFAQPSSGESANEQGKVTRRNDVHRGILNNLV